MKVKGITANDVPTGPYHPASTRKLQQPDRAEGFEDGQRSMKVVQCVPDVKPRQGKVAKLLSCGGSETASHPMHETRQDKETGPCEPSFDSQMARRLIPRWRHERRANHGGIEGDDYCTSGGAACCSVLQRVKWLVAGVPRSPQPSTLCSCAALRCVAPRCTLSVSDSLPSLSFPRISPA